MSTQLFTNYATTTLTTAISNSITTFTVATGTGNLFPAFTNSANDFYYVTLTSSTNPTYREIVKVTGRTLDSFTVVRGQDGTTGLAFNALDTVTQTTVAGNFNPLYQPYVDITTTIDAGANVITPGNKVFLPIPFDCQIFQWDLIADNAGTISIQLNTSTPGTFPTLVPISAATPPSLASVQYTSSTVLTSWVTTITAGSILVLTVTGTPTLIKLCTLRLKVLKI